MPPQQLPFRYLLSVEGNSYHTPGQFAIFSKYLESQRQMGIPEGRQPNIEGFTGHSQRKTTGWGIARRSAA